MKNSNIKFVIIGNGNIANTYLTGIQHIDDVEVVGIVSSKSKKTTNSSHLPLFSNLDKINLDFDAVIVCTPNGYHHIGPINAAKLRKHVLCEKPIDISLTVIDKMIAVCKNNKVKLGVVYQRRYSGDNAIVKQLINQNKIGKIFSVDLSIINYRDASYYNSVTYRGTFKIDGGGSLITGESARNATEIF